MAYELNGYYRMAQELRRVEVCPLLDKYALNIYKKLGEVEPCISFHPNIRPEHYIARRRVKSFRICDILGEPAADHRKESDHRHNCDIEPNSHWNQRCMERIFTGNSKDIYGLSKQNIFPLIRPWERPNRERLDPFEFQSPFIRSEKSVDDESDDEIIDVEDDDPVVSMSPLDALAEMSSKTFGGFDGSRTGGKGSDGSSPILSGRSQSLKKKRKTRTAFSNQQIYELEKRFHSQKYITPVDRDEISMALGLTSSQVITWFQNRRAKFKRDIEEMKNDVTATSKTQYKGPHNDKSSAKEGIQYKGPHNDKFSAKEG